MTVASIMMPNPLTMRADQTVGEAVKLLREHRFRSVPVLETDGRMLGQFSVHTILQLIMPKVATMRGMGMLRIGFLRDDMDDLRRRLSDEWDEPLRDHAKTEVDVILADTPMTQTLLSLYDRQENLPVVDESGKLIGILSYWDVIDHLVEGPQA